MKWNIVHECDNDNGDPTQWACKLTEDGQFVWIDKIGECAFGITNKASGEDYLYVAGSLQGANMKDARPQDMSYYNGALKALEFAGYEWKRDADGKHTLFK